MGLSGSETLLASPDFSFPQCPSSYLPSKEPVPIKSSKKKDVKEEVIQSKSSGYNRNAYLRYYVEQLVKENPYITLHEIRDNLKHNKIKHKESTVSRCRNEAREKYITSMKEMVNAMVVISRSITLSLDLYHA